jgi:hypothetical protein
LPGWFAEAMLLQIKNIENSVDLLGAIQLAKDRKNYVELCAS